MHELGPLLGPYFWGGLALGGGPLRSPQHEGYSKTTGKSDLSIAM